MLFTVYNSLAMCRLSSYSDEKRLVLSVRNKVLEFFLYGTYSVFVLSGNVVLQTRQSSLNIFVTKNITVYLRLVTPVPNFLSHLLRFRQRNSVNKVFSYG